MLLSRRRSITVVAGVVAALLMCLAAWYSPIHVSHKSVGEPATVASASKPGQIKAHFVGSDRCQSCHEAAYAAWARSDHAQAMAKASSLTVRGDFHRGDIEVDGHPLAFSRQDDDFRISLANKDGKVHKYGIAYTFGVYPLQQYLVPFPDGRLQALPYAWDSRPAKQGGQRWFLLQEDEIRSDDPLHWTGPSLNWDRSCADCHSTGLKQTFDPKTGHYAAQWSDIDVACEACHGPASRHVAWARQSHRDDDSTKGLVFNLTGASSSAWVFDEDDSIAHRQPAGANRSEVETCGRCHARRARIAADYTFGQPLEDSYRVALLDPGLYFADGQQKDEVYEYGSFLQSRMYAAGVTCSNCHKPHTGQLRRRGNALCAQCHKPKKFDTTTHHHHKVGSVGSQCVGCHMPTRTYMKIDARRDHSFRIPRPDLSAKLDTPNACTGCHEKHTSDWAAKKIENWNPDRRLPHHYGEALWAGRRWQPGAPARLKDLADNRTQPAIARASALKLLTQYPGQKLANAAKRAATADSPLLRRVAAQALPLLKTSTAAGLADQLLKDDVLTVRVEAAKQLLRVKRAVTNRIESDNWESALNELRAGLESRREAAESLLGLAALAQHDGDNSKAGQLLHEAVKRRPRYPPAWVNLADWLRAQGRNVQAVDILERGVNKAPKAAALRYALGLAQVHAGQRSQALVELRHAWELAPETPHYAYVYAIALHDMGYPDRALHFLERAKKRFPAHQGISSVLASYTKLTRMAATAPPRMMKDTRSGRRRARSRFYLGA